jgi:RsiW-degrading membrane proteinase PrsW (M82 family)
LGPEYAARFYISIVITTLLLFSTITYRIAFGCDGTGILILTALLGILLGALLVYQNNYLFGRDATNLTGVPLLVERTKDGKPLYVCTTNQG